jgi:hypothetical protein
MNRDVKEIVGVLMRVLDGGEASHEQLAELSFEADGELQEALNAAYIKLIEFAHDRELRSNDNAIDQEMRSALQTCLNRIIRAWDAESQSRTREASS